MDKIMQLKSEAFDIRREQERLNEQINQLEQLRQQKVQEMWIAEQQLTKQQQGQSGQVEQIFQQVREHRGFTPDQVKDAANR
ncbi:hypothetical protein HSX37_05570|uniref:Uncharacterized protein n=1 Tax=Dendrosporobacter quercicolus TaxID=146817 RepID=A0A1G9P2E3_9FIRM|nr:hypothetical protein [Dendrosporobacter quercicolus]NSL47511.1 hypothetical protein [Dendrosporobacter quercicolus DSM 1736]SDL92417.1 hypothetical protein SAMN04488502_1011191 [Dendrosporobacter quercicolus]